MEIFKTRMAPFLAKCHWTDWTEQGLPSPPTQYKLSGRQFYRSEDSTNSIKVLKEKLASHCTEEAPNPPGASHRVTSEPLKKKNPITVGRAQRDKAPHSRLACTSPVQNYRLRNATQHLSKTGLGILYPHARSQHRWWNVAKVWRDAKCHICKNTAMAKCNDNILSQNRPL